MSKNNIYIRQNEERFINMLAAQRQLYSEGKVLSNRFLFSSILIPFAFLFLSHFLQYGYNETFLYTLTGILVVYLLWTFFDVNNKKKYAAQIQEMFDTELLGIQWNDKYHRIPNLTDELIERIALKIESPHELKYWYSDYSDQEPQVAALKCQEENLKWDSKQRGTYTTFLFLLLVLLSVLTGYLVKSNRLNDLNWLSFLPFSAVSLFILYTVASNWLTTRSMTTRFLGYKYELKHLPPNSDHSILLRNIQDYIYDGRKNGILVPDWFYQWFKQGIQHKIYKFDSSQGEIKIETTEWSWFPKTRLQKAAQSFDQAFASVDQISQSTVKKLESTGAEEITLEMSIKVSGDVGAYIAKASGEGQMKVTVKWSKNTKITN